MIQKEKIMIQKSEAKELEALIYGVLEKFFSNLASGATLSIFHLSLYSSLEKHFYIFPSNIKPRDKF